MKPGRIEADWPAPPNVRAFCSTRSGGCSQGPYRSLNLGRNCGDDPGAVQRNRDLLESILPGAPAWLEQVHGNRVVRFGRALDSTQKADAIVAAGPAQVCAVLTADCLPVLFCSRDGKRVAAAHAGWRGLAAGILPATVRALGRPPNELLAWLGPAIGPSAYEVGRDVLEAMGADGEHAFQASGERWLLDLYRVARNQLAGCGLDSIHGGNHCTYSEPDRFYSYRRDGVTGRMACLVWRE